MLRGGDAESNPRQLSLDMEPATIEQDAPRTHEDITVRPDVDRRRWEGRKFKRKEIELLREGGEKVSVQAHVYGGAGVHPDVLGDGKIFAVSHLQTGRQIVTGFASLEDAKVAAARLSETADLDAIKRQPQVWSSQFAALRDLAKAMSESKDPLAVPSDIANPPSATGSDASSPNPKGEQDEHQQI